MLIKKNLNSIERKFGKNIAGHHPSLKSRRARNFRQEAQSFSHRENENFVQRSLVVLMKFEKKISTTIIIICPFSWPESWEDSILSWIKNDKEIFLPSCRDSGSFPFPAQFIELVFDKSEQRESISFVFWFLDEIIQHYWLMLEEHYHLRLLVQRFWH